VSDVNRYTTLGIYNISSIRSYHRHGNCHHHHLLQSMTMMMTTDDDNDS